MSWIRNPAYNAEELATWLVWRSLATWLVCRSLATWLVWRSLATWLVWRSGGATWLVWRSGGATWLVWRSLAAAVVSSSPLNPRTWVSFMATCVNSAGLLSLSSSKISKKFGNRLFYVGRRQNFLNFFLLISANNRFPLQRMDRLNILMFKRLKNQRRRCKLYAVRTTYVQLFTKSAKISVGRKVSDPH
jgi:hypothetical protein